jgi:hypothetical protein
VPIDKAFPVAVSNGKVESQFSSGAANLPLVNAIEIRQSMRQRFRRI